MSCKLQCMLFKATKKPLKQKTLIGFLHFRMDPPHPPLCGQQAQHVGRTELKVTVDRLSQCHLEVIHVEDFTSKEYYNHPVNTRGHGSLTSGDKCLSKLEKKYFKQFKKEFGFSKNAVSGA